MICVKLRFPSFAPVIFFVAYRLVESFNSNNLQHAGNGNFRPASAEAHYSFMLSFHSIFRLIDGFETLDEFEKIPTNEKNFRPFEELKLKSVTIHANPLAG